MPSYAITDQEVSKYTNLLNHFDRLTYGLNDNQVYASFAINNGPPYEDFKLLTRNQVEECLETSTRLRDFFSRSYPEEIQDKESEESAALEKISERAKTFNVALKALDNVDSELVEQIKNIGRDHAFSYMSPGKRFLYQLMEPQVNAAEEPGENEKFLSADEIQDSMNFLKSFRRLRYQSEGQTSEQRHIGEGRIYAEFDGSDGATYLLDSGIISICLNNSQETLQALAQDHKEELLKNHFQTSIAFNTTAQLQEELIKAKEAVTYVGDKWFIQDLKSHGFSEASRKPDHGVGHTFLDRAFG